MRLSNPAARQIPQAITATTNYDVSPVLGKDFDEFQANALIA